MHSPSQISLDLEVNLRHATARAMQVKPCPAELLAKCIAQMGVNTSCGVSATEKQVSAQKSSIAGFLYSPGRWRYGIAAMAALTFTVGYAVGHQGWQNPMEVASHAQEQMEQRMVEKNGLFEKTPMLLTGIEKFPDKLHADFKVLQAQIKKELATQEVLPLNFDLQSLGYTYTCAATSDVTASNGVQVVYHNTKGESVGIWMDVGESKEIGEPNRIQMVITPQYSVGHYRDGRFNVHVIAPTATDLRYIIAILQAK